MKTNVRTPSFLDSFTEEQKAAIIYTLMIVSIVDGYDNRKYELKENYFIQQSKLLKLDLEGDSMSIYEEKNVDYAYSVIKSFTKKQKTWYSILLGTITLLDKVTENEKKIVSQILDECEISHEQFQIDNEKMMILRKNLDS